jgi:hypothetical protein
MIFFVNANIAIKTQKMNIKKIVKPLIFSVVLGLMIFSSCKKDDIKSPRELYEEEMALLEKFKEGDVYQSWIEQADSSDTDEIFMIDSSETGGRYNGLVYFQLEKGYTIIEGDSVPGDTVLLGKRVGIKFKMYYILDSVGAEEPYLALVAGNETSANPIVYTVGQPDATSGIYPGLDLGIRFMNCYGKSRILIPSPLGGNDYVTRVIEVKINYISR